MQNRKTGRTEYINSYTDNVKLDFRLASFRKVSFTNRVAVFLTLHEGHKEDDEEDLCNPEVKYHNKKIAGKLSLQNRLVLWNLQIFFTLKIVWVFAASRTTSCDMEEYEELLYEQDDFEEQFADELEVLAEMDGEFTLTNQPSFVTNSMFILKEITDRSRDY